MKFSDVLLASLNNLLRRKLRTALTMLGVVIGTAAIVVTISLGYGAERAQMEQLENNTDLTIINVYPNWGGYGGSDDSRGPQTRRVDKLTDKILNEIRAIPGVDAVTPMEYLWFGAEFYIQIGDYTASFSPIAVSAPDFAKLSEVADGRNLTNAHQPMEMVWSKSALTGFLTKKQRLKNEWFDSWDWEYTHPNEPFPYPDLPYLRAKPKGGLRWMKYPEDNYEAEPIEMTFEIPMKIVGLNDFRYMQGNMQPGVYVSLNWLRRFERKNKALLKELNYEPLSAYNNVIVKTKSVDDVEGVLDALYQLGVSSANPLDMIRTMKQSIATMQVFFGFIGAIAMMVAAISIANTMLMSINERTREIGVMKVLGCKLSNIRLMFLTEAAYIGLFGGLFGLMLSYGVSYALNNVEALQKLVSSVIQTDGFYWGAAQGGPSVVSLIPHALSLYTWLAVVSVSVLSGFYPAQRAMGLSSLAAIRNSE